MIKVSTKSTFAEKQNCCGCGACADICPKKCINMEADQEGFLYPVVDKNKCINCGLCERVCPVLQVEGDKPFKQDGYIVQNKDEQVRKESTSGGAFTAIAKRVIQAGGIVFGAAYDDNFQVKHIAVNNENELWRFRNSKYTQSRTVEAFQKVKAYLKGDKLVCFSGTPCQVEGLKKFLQKEYDNLLTVDVVCHAVPSPLVFQKYVAMQEQQYGNVSDILFRNKEHYGYKYSTMTIKNSADKDVYSYGVDTDPMLRAFFSDVCDRPSCYNCHFKKRYRVSDLTIWDCFPVYEFNKDMDDDKGTTRVLIHTDKGRQLFEKIKQDMIYMEVDADRLTYGVKEMFHSVNLAKNRKAFMADAAVMSGNKLFAKWFPKTLKVRFNHMARLSCIKLRIYTPAKRIAKALLRK